MRVTCASLKGFEENLADTETIYNDCLYIETVTKEISEVKNEIWFSATCLIINPDGGECLLEFSKMVGFDYWDGDGKKEGTHIAESYLDRARALAAEKGWIVRPGLLGAH